MEKAKYRVLRLSHIHNNLWPEGSEIEYDGEPGSALEPLNDAAAKAKKDVAKKRGEKYDAQKSPKRNLMMTVAGNSDEVGELDKLREEYEVLFNEKPHHNVKAETLREKIADKRKELGV
jgi:NTP pyrophosphatase (non-canonical NTP hydrolase)